MSKLLCLHKENKGYSLYGLYGYSLYSRILRILLQSSNSLHVNAAVALCNHLLCVRCFLFVLRAQDSPINKLLYARDIPRYKQMVER